MQSMLTWLPECPALAGVQATHMTIDSREVVKNTIFVALEGFQVDGHEYIDEAIANGASAVLCEKQVDFQKSVPVCVVENLKDRLGELTHEFYGKATNQMLMVGVTGTNGKTSTCQYVAQALDYLGKRCGIIGTNGQGLWGQLSETLNTTPDVVRLHRELARQHVQGAQYCAMEVSSHGLDQGRVNGVRFSTAVFTNLSRDHLDYHKTMEAYGNAKWKLMAWPELNNAIVNVDDEWAQNHLDKVQAKKVWTYGIERQADVSATSIRAHSAGLDAKVETSLGTVELNLRLLGRFNLSNALAAFTVLLAEGIPINTAARVISNTRAVHGRMEMMRMPQAPTVVVDYAHTPDALTNALEACKEHVSGRLGVIFGCGGDRDTGKRAQMAAAAEAIADFIVVTDDNPRSESSENIINQVCEGFSQLENVTVISDRRDAILKTLDRCDKDDVILIAGKGHESYQEIEGVRHPFSDQETVQLWEETRDVE
ncbi:UDP-N-acetylmuramoyl-L-alanyl-D-glutamate--2,6-diaminopimelate ligase [Reinekea marina]|uniref:UDP-N-acetylmuramoyl-L-alanyl-D-glutamate--2,6-diaminopimelate ligase n=1 Tax=Reinekea marina TaxID=1310421 RepID=A0ABV7WS27_9GAMM|nr:UDP-N-acetylmuramoyl-L-alanyl-D-glutamate--2,6-diaminopimelate ligase [Reinekea marina]MDN3650531.1 UDP-N-acetylmuramoyl-L-alanyl-D-glutamate--2,6-diaminopimelate ligase [Reinekea marina]